MSSEIDNKYLYTANKSVGDTVAESAAPQCDWATASGLSRPYGFTTTTSGNVANGQPGSGCYVERWVTNLSTTNNKITHYRWDKDLKKLIPPSGGIQACTNVCDEDFDKLNICVPVDWDQTQGKPTECKKTIVAPDKKGRLPPIKYFPVGCTNNKKKISKGAVKCTSNSWCPDGYRPGTNLQNNNAVPMTNPYHNSQYCINARKTNPPSTNPPSTNPPSTNPPSTNPPSTNPPSTNPPSTNPPSTNPPYTGPPFGKKSGMSKGTIIAIVSGSVALIGGIVTAILLSKKKTLIYKSLDR